MKRKALYCLLALLAAAAPAFAELTLTRAEFARDVTGREPEGVAEKFPPNVGKVIFFNQISGVTTATEVKHVWIFDNRVEMEVRLPVETDRWRMWSVKKIDPAQQGLWHVEVLDPAGNVIKSTTFTIGN